MCYLKETKLYNLRCQRCGHIERVITLRTENMGFMSTLENRLDRMSKYCLCDECLKELS